MSDATLPALIFKLHHYPATLSGLAVTETEAAQARVALNGRIRQSVVFWCFNSAGEKWNIERTCRAAVELGWDRYIGFQGRFVGMHGFGDSGKGADVFKKFDINAEAVARAARETLAAVAAL